MKPKNDEEKYPQKYRFQALKPPKMKSKIQKILSQKIIEKYVQKWRDRHRGTPGSHPCHTKGGTVANAANIDASLWSAVATCPAGKTDSA